MFRWEKIPLFFYRYWILTRLGIFHFTSITMIILVSPDPTFSCGPEITHLIDNN